MRLMPKREKKGFKAFPRVRAMRAEKRRRGISDVSCIIYARKKGCSSKKNKQHTL